MYMALDSMVKNLEIDVSSHLMEAQILEHIHIHLVLYKYPLSVVGSCYLLKLKGIGGKYL
jgi:hypothetical protein